MATGLAIILHCDALDEEINSRNSRIARRRLRDKSNPFDAPIEHFIQLFRLDKETALYLIEKLNPFLNVSRYRGRLPSHIKVFTALNFFSHGSYQGVTGRNHYLSLSQPSVSRCVNEVSQAIYQHLAAEWIIFPRSDREIATEQSRFIQKFNFHGVVGCVDGTHIAIIKPSYNNNRQAYCNRKGFFSINTQIVCGADLKILAVNALFPGCTHDSAIWRTSSVRIFLENRNANGCWLLGDSGYPSEPWLLTPVENPGEGTPESRYNKAHTKTRNVVERCIGVLKSRFRCILKHRVLHYSPTVAGRIIYSCAVLHNMCISRNITLHDVAGEGRTCNDGTENITDQGPVTRNSTRGRQVRNDFIDRYFS